MFGIDIDMSSVRNSFCNNIFNKLLKDYRSRAFGVEQLFLIRRGSASKKGRGTAVEGNW